MAARKTPQFRDPRTGRFSSTFKLDPRQLYWLPSYNAWVVPDIAGDPMWISRQARVYHGTTHGGVKAPIAYGADVFTALWVRDGGRPGHEDGIWLVEGSKREALVREMLSEVYG